MVRAITQRAFIALAVVYIVGACILVGLSEGRLGREWVFVDVGACALFGKFNKCFVDDVILTSASRRIYGALYEGCEFAVDYGVVGYVHGMDHIPRLGGTGIPCAWQCCMH